MGSELAGPIFEYTGEDLDRFMAVAQELAKEAGLIIKSAFGKAKQVKSKGLSSNCNASNVLTETDRAVEAHLLKGLKAAFPDHHFIGEEGVGAEADQPSCGGTIPESAFPNAPTWIIDPIDGTMNFVHSNPLVVTSIGLAINRKPVLGVIYAPIIDQMYTAAEGRGGVRLNGALVRVSNVRSLSEAMVILEPAAGSSADKREVTLANMAVLLEKAHSIRSPGPSALDIAWVASGASDAFFHCGIHCWDIAAGVVMVKEAGGVVKSPDGGKFDLMSRCILVASTEDLANQLVSVATLVPVKREFKEPCLMD